MNAQALVGLLAEPERMRIVASLALDGPQAAASIADRSGVELRAVVDGLDRMCTAGLVEDLGGEFVLLEAAFKLAARQEAPAAPPTSFPDEPGDRRRILDQCLKDGRLVHMPTKRSKRLVLLEELVQRFEPGERYTERQVNASLASVSSDTATLRRYMVDEELLDRADGEYWRCGGPIR
ncbi:MAG: DUF2087 domain-containing protein [Acidimicrobiales bacterium]|nr:DUF2087 domain-containing protein [Acidimicrobiales bacterium]